MGELIANKDHSVNLLKCSLEATSDHVIRKNEVGSIVDEDLVLELELCQQDEFRDQVVAKAEIL